MHEKIVIKNGFIVDGSGAPGFSADVEITGDRISRIAKQGITGQTVIDASGMTVSPGFVDIHSHSDYHVLLNPFAESKVRQGVTTEVNGNCGYSIAPVGGVIRKEREEQYSGSYKLDLKIRSLQDYVDRIRKQGTALNLAMLVGHGTIRGSVMGRKAAKPSEKELDAMKLLIRESMQSGAFGISTGLAYTPGAYADTGEITQLARVAADYNGIYATHMRSEGRELIQSIEEALTIGKQADISVEISHLKTMHPENWHKLDRAFGLIESARKDGLRVGSDRYPYLSAYTGLASVMPDWVFADSTEEALRRLKDGQSRQRIESEIALQHSDAADYFSRIMISQCFTDEYKRFEGKTIPEIAGDLRIEPLEAIYRILIHEKLMTTAIYFAMNEDNLRSILTKPYVSIGSDAGLRADYGPLHEGKPHPRAYGTYPRVFSDFVKTGALQLEEAIHKMTAMPAQKAGIAMRGMIKEGWFADLVIFSPDQMEDRATYVQPHVYPKGIDTVIVNGVTVVQKGGHTRALPGKMLTKITPEK